MRVRTRITQEARARGMTAAELARRLGWYRSNVSAMDAGRRAASMRALARVAEALGCSPGDLMQLGPDADAPVFRRSQVNRRLTAREAAIPDGTEQGWVHAVQFAWRRHYGAAARAR